MDKSNIFEHHINEYHKINHEKYPTTIYNNYFTNPILPK